MSTQPPAWIPEYIDSGNLDGLAPLGHPHVVPVRLQAETRGDVARLALALDISRSEAVRWALEVGMVALYRAGILPEGCPSCTPEGCKPCGATSPIDCLCDDEPTRQAARDLETEPHPCNDPRCSGYPRHAGTCSKRAEPIRQAARDMANGQAVPVMVPLERPSWRGLKSTDARKPRAVAALRASQGVTGGRVTCVKVSKDGQWIMGDLKPRRTGAWERGIVVRLPEDDGRCLGSIPTSQPGTVARCERKTGHVGLCQAGHITFRSAR